MIINKNLITYEMRPKPPLFSSPDTRGTRFKPFWECFLGLRRVLLTLNQKNLICQACTPDYSGVFNNQNKTGGDNGEVI